MTQQIPAPAAPAPSNSTNPPSVAVDVTANVAKAAADVVVTVSSIQEKIAYLEALGAQIEKDIENAPAEVKAEFELVESKVVTFVKTHLTASLLVDMAASALVGAVIAHVLK